MHIVHVSVHVKPDSIDAFKAATIENARQSIQEPGITRFDFVQRQDDPARFMLVEVYRRPEDVDAHKQTAHYNKWAETVKPMLAEDRTKELYTEVFPEETGWG